MTRLIRMMATAGLGSAVLLSGCAHYRPEPLGEPALLAPAGAASIASATAAVDRAYLHRVPVDIAQPLDANAVAVLAVSGNPDLRALRTRAGVADAQLFAAQLLPDPTVSTGFDKILTGPDTMLALSTQIAIDLMALRDRHVVLAAARAAGQQVRLDLAWAEWQTAGQARLQAARIVALEQTVELTRVAAVSANDLLLRVTRAVARGDLRADDLETRRLAALDASDRARVAENALSTAQFQLVELAGLPPETVLRLQPQGAMRPLPPAAALFATARAQRFDLAALRAGYQSQEAAVHKAVLDQFPTLSLAVNNSRDTAGNQTVGPSVGFTLPLWNRNRGGIRVAAATRAALHAEYDARLFTARADIAAAVAAITVRQRQRAELAAALPELDRLAEASTRAALHGDIAPVIAATTQSSARDKRLQLIDTDQQIAEARIALELLTGTPEENWPR